jgi:hypothetical protein
MSTAALILELAQWAHSFALADREWRGSLPEVLIGLRRMYEEAGGAVGGSFTRVDVEAALARRVSTEEMSHLFRGCP